MTGIMMAGVGATGSAPSPPLSAVAAPSTEAWVFDGAESWYMTGDVTATPTGGTSPYTYAWEYVSGAGLALNEFSATTAFLSYSNPASVFRCLVTDALGASAYTNNVSIS